MKFHEAIIQALIDGWHAEADMMRTIRRSYHLADIEIQDGEDWINRWRKTINVNVDLKHAMVRTWLPIHMPTLNNALWDGRQNAHCMAVGLRGLGVRPRSIKASMIVRVRDRDKRRDWGTVK